MPIAVAVRTCGKRGHRTWLCCKEVLCVPTRALVETGMCPHGRR